MDRSLQPLMLMMMTSMKNENNNYLLSFLLLIIPFLKPLGDMLHQILQDLNKKKDNIQIIISTHELPVVRSFSNVPVTKLIYSKKFLSIVDFLNKIESDPESNILSLTEVITNNTELNCSYSGDDTNKYVLMPINNKNILLDKSNNIYCDFIEIKDDEEKDDKNKQTLKLAQKKKFMIILYKEITSKNARIIMI